MTSASRARPFRADISRLERLRQLDCLFFQDRFRPLLNRGTQSQAGEVNILSCVGSGISDQFSGFQAQRHLSLFSVYDDDIGPWFLKLLSPTE